MTEKKRTGKQIVFLLFFCCLLLNSCNPRGRERARFTFYRQNNAADPALFELFYTPGLLYRFPECGCSDYRVSSLRLQAIAPGLKILFFRSRDLSLDEDWCEVTVKRYLKNYVINSFEHTFEDKYINLKYHGALGLDGQIAVIKCAEKTVETAGSVVSR